MIYSEDHGTDSSDPESSPSPPPSKKVCKSSKNKRYHRSVSTKRKYSKSWEKDFSWLHYDEDSEGAFCKICKQSGISGLQRTGGVWVTKSFKNWKKAVEKMKAHSRSDSHSHATQAMLAAKRAVVDGTVVQQLQNVEAHKRAQNRAAMKCLILLTHFLTKEHIAHSTKFEKLVDVVVRCGSQQLKQYLETAPRNATYLDEGPVFRHVSRNTLLMLCFYTATVIYCSWLVCNLPIKLLALLMFTEH